MLRRMMGKVTSNKGPMTVAMGISFASIFVCYRYQVTKNDFIKRNLFDRIFDREKYDRRWMDDGKFDRVDCTGLNPYDVLAHLYNESRPVGMGWLQVDYTVMDREGAKKILDKANNRNELFLEDIHGRPIYIHFDFWPHLYPEHYDRNNGNKNGTMRNLIHELRETGEISTKIPRKKTQQEIKYIAAKYQEDLRAWVLQQEKDDYKNSDQKVKNNYEKFS